MLQPKHGSSAQQKSLQMDENMGIKVYNFFRFGLMFLIFYLFLPLYVLASEVAVVKSHHSISVKCSWYRDTGPTDPSLVCIMFSYLEIE